MFGSCLHHNVSPGGPVSVIDTIHPALHSNLHAYLHIAFVSSEAEILESIVSFIDVGEGSHALGHFPGMGISKLLNRS